MATPTRSHATSTPKSHLPVTPSRPIASPRPASSATAQKSLALKSPASKTPASLYGYAQARSASSQPSSTPLGVAHIQNELLNLNSPAAALINSMVPSGMTPMASGLDGLGIPVQSHAATIMTNSIRSTEPERIQRLRQVVDGLRSKVTGRGLDKESIDRIARLQGFESLLEGNVLSVAGNIVDMEITFDDVQTERVKDLTLRLNTDEGEAELQAAATEILKDQVGITKNGQQQLEFNDAAGAFAENLSYLARLDQIQSSPNCFEVVGGLYNAFQTIWKEEKKRKEWRNEISQLRSGCIGRPCLNANSKLGIRLDYWSNESAASAQQPSENEDEKYAINVQCDTGLPHVTIPEKWLGEEILTQRPSKDNVLDIKEDFPMPNWHPVSESTAGVDAAVAEDSNMDDNKPNDRAQKMDGHFTGKLEPEVYIPLGTIAMLNNSLPMISIDQNIAITYQEALQKSSSLPSSSSHTQPPGQRWSRQLHSVESAAGGSPPIYSYALYASSMNADIWVQPVSQIVFTHPKQLSEILPALRQQAVLNMLLKSLVIGPVHPPTAPVAKPQATPKIRKRTNAKAQITDKAIDATATSREATGIPVDFTLDVISDPHKPKLDVLLPRHGLADGKRSRDLFVHLAISVGLNGVVEVGELDIPNVVDPEKLKARLGKMLSSTGDMGLVLHWLMTHYLT